MITSKAASLTRPALICAVALAGLLAGFFLGPLSPPHRVQALDSVPRPLAQPSPRELSVVVNAILYDVVTYIVDLPVIMNNAP
ncbi:MAG: hypothetical protein NTY23_01220 [Chloroflexi bacterium]|nr:hypothetical protein [Chloroflexota bacterium]